MYDVISFLSALRSKSNAIWVEHGVIKMSTPQQFQDEMTKLFLLRCKDDLIKVLTENNITNKESFLSNSIINNASSPIYYPLTRAQEQRLLMAEGHANSDPHKCKWVISLKNDKNLDGIKFALQQIVKRHEILRSTFVKHVNQFIQVVHKTPLEIKEFIVEESQYEVQLKEHTKIPFQISSEYPIRVRVYKVISSEKQTILHVDLHGIANDHYSNRIFRKEIISFHGAFLRNDFIFQLPELEIQYKDYAAWQRSSLSKRHRENAMTYWREKLKNYQPLTLPTDKPRPKIMERRVAQVHFSLSIELTRKLRAVAKNNDATFSTVILTGLTVLLSKYTGQNDIVIGNTIPNRHFPHTELLIGLFANIQIIRSKVDGSHTFNQLLNNTQRDQVEMQPYQDFPIEDLLAEFAGVDDPSKHPLFQIMLEVHNYDENDQPIRTHAKSESESTIAMEVNENPETKFDLSIQVTETANETIGLITYATGLFNQVTMTRLATHFEYLLNQLTQFPDSGVASLSLISPQEFEMIVRKWNQTDVEYPFTKSIHELFELQAQKTPDCVALIDQSQHLTFRQVSERSNQLAHHLLNCKKSNSFERLGLVALCVNPGVDLAIGILGILKAGGAYVPIDISYPKERIKYILHDTQAEVIVIQNSTLELLNLDFAGNIVIIDLHDTRYLVEPVTALSSINFPDDLAYVIYTSGTTGEPKGVMISHRSVCNYNHWMIGHAIFADTKRIDCSSSIAFDATVNVLITPLCNGQTVIFCPSGIKRDVSRYLEYLYRNQIELIKITPSYFSLLLGIMNRNCLPALKSIILGGEKANKKDLLAFQQLFPHIRILHHYGPTETTVGITSFSDFEDAFFLSQMETVPLGKVAWNNRAYVLNSDLEPVPIGTVGELFISGANLGIGYLNQPELSAQKFVDNIYATPEDIEKGYTRLYKTGDLVKWLDNGNLEFIGRNDSQVKIQGYRIELGEIEYYLKQIPEIQDACVVLKEVQTEVGAVNYVAGYFVTNDPDLTQASIIRKLTLLLPEYMIPSVLVRLDKLPLNINGKLDRRLLSER